MRDLMISLFGQYTPVTFIEPETSAEVVAQGAAGIDWPWVLGVLIFALALYSLFRIVGCFFRR